MGESTEKYHESPTPFTGTQEKLLLNSFFFCFSISLSLSLSLSLSFFLSPSFPPVFFPLNSRRIMKTLGNRLRKVPPGAAIKILRRGFLLPTPAARVLFNDILKPEKWHRKWIYKVRWNHVWWGGWIGENISKLDHDGMMNRIARADVILFHVHGKYY